MSSDECPACSGLGQTLLGNQLLRCVLCNGTGQCKEEAVTVEPEVELSDERPSALESFQIANERRTRRHEESYKKAWKTVVQYRDDGYMSCNLRFSTPQARDRFISEANALWYSIRQTDGLVVCSWSNPHADDRRNSNRVIFGRFPVPKKD